MTYDHAIQLLTLLFSVFMRFNHMNFEVKVFSASLRVHRKG